MKQGKGNSSILVTKFHSVNIFGSQDRAVIGGQCLPCQPCIPAHSLGFLGLSQSMPVICAESLNLPSFFISKWVNWLKSVVLNCVPRPHARVSRAYEQKLSLVSIQSPRAVSVQHILKLCLIFWHKSWETPVGKAQWKPDQENLEKRVKRAAI